MKKTYVKPQVETEERLEQTSLACLFEPNSVAFIEGEGVGCLGAKDDRLYEPQTCEEGYQVLVDLIICEIDVENLPTWS